MSIEDALARDLVAILFVTFLFGGGILWLIVATIAEQWWKVRVGEKNAALKQAMVLVRRLLEQSRQASLRGFRVAQQVHAR